MKIILFFSIFLLSKFVQAQNTQILDSLNYVYQTASEDTVKILTQIRIANQYLKSNTDTSITLIEKSIDWSKKNNFESGIAEGNYLLSRVFFYRAKYVLSLEYLILATKIYEKNQDKKQIAQCYANMGSIHNQQGNYHVALACFQKSVKIHELINYKKGLGQNFNSIGVAYDNLKEQKSALKYYKKALNVFENIGFKHGTANVLGNIGLIYESQGNYTIALEHYFKCLDVQEKMNDHLNIGVSLVNIGTIYQKQNKFSLALAIFEKAKQIQISIGDKWGQTYAWNGIALVKLKLKNYDEGILFAHKGLLLAQEINALSEVKMLSETLYKLYKLQGNFSKALTYFELFKKSNDSLFTIEKSKAIANLETREEIIKKDKEMLVLAKENEQKIAEKMLYIYSISFILVTMFVVLFFISRNNKLQKKLNNQLSLQKKEIEIKNDELMASEEELKESQEEMRQLNNNLETLVEERTKKLFLTNQKLSKYAFFNAHKLRAPIATILGLYEILALGNTNAEREFIYEKIKETTLKLDEVVKQSQSLLNDVDD